jgi:predicted metal-dependent phosphotriesterase family hydrolase
MDNISQRRVKVNAAEENMLCKVARAAATELTPIEVHSICVLLSMAFGRGTIESRIFARKVNAIRLDLGLPEITHTVAGNPTTEEKMKLLRSAMAKLGDAQAVLISVLDADSKRS